MHQGILSPYYICNKDAYFLDFRAQKIPLIFLCLRHEMAEGHTEFTVCLCTPDSCPGHNLAINDGI